MPTRPNVVAGINTRTARAPTPYITNGLIKKVIASNVLSFPYQSVVTGGGYFNLTQPDSYVGLGIMDYSSVVTMIFWMRLASSPSTSRIYTDMGYGLLEGIAIIGTGDTNNPLQLVITTSANLLSIVNIPAPVRKSQFIAIRYNGPAGSVNIWVKSPDGTFSNNDTNLGAPSTITLMDEGYIGHDTGSPSIPPIDGGIKAFLAYNRLLTDNELDLIYQSMLQEILDKINRPAGRLVSRQELGTYRLNIQTPTAVAGVVAP